MLVEITLRRTICKKQVRLSSLNSTKKLLTNLSEADLFLAHKLRHLPIKIASTYTKEKGECKIVLPDTAEIKDRPKFRSLM